MDNVQHIGFFYKKMAEMYGPQTAVKRLRGAKLAYRNSKVKDNKIVKLYDELEALFSKHGQVK